MPTEGNDVVVPLSPGEREVAALLARGLSNRQIAGGLVISGHTAERLVEHILGKLGFRSRMRVAVWPAGRALADPAASHPAPGATTSPPQPGTDIGLPALLPPAAVLDPGPDRVTQSAPSGRHRNYDLLRRRPGDLLARSLRLPARMAQTVMAPWDGVRGAR